MSRDEYEDAGLPAPGSPEAAERDAITEALSDEPELAPVFEALAASLAEEGLPVGGWEALQSRLAADDAAGQAVGAATPPVAGAPDAGRGMPPGRAAASSEPWDRYPAAATKRAVPGRGGEAGRWLVAAVLAAAVVVAGSWGSLKAGEAAELRDDQRILAYWMANPEMRLIALSAPGGQAGEGRPRLGVVCILPDGRGLLLQPSAAPRGATFVVTGEGPDGAEELARGRGNMLQFDAGGVSSVEVALAGRNGIVEPLAEAVLD